MMAENSLINQTSNDGGLLLKKSEAVAANGKGVDGGDRRDETPPIIQIDVGRSSGGTCTEEEDDVRQPSPRSPRRRCRTANISWTNSSECGDKLEARNDNVILLLPPSPPPPPPPSPSPSTVDGASAKATPTRQHKKAAKSVSFHSATSLPTERKISNANDCLQYMMTGSNLLKIRSSSRQYHRFFTLTEDLTAMRWTPTNKKSTKAMLSIDSIREIRSGKNTDVFRNKELAGSHSADCSFSIIFGETFEVLDLVAPTPEEANIWATGLNALIGASKSPVCNLEERQHLRENWLQDMFRQADTDNRGSLGENQTVELITRLNRILTINRVKQKIVEMDQQKVEGSRGKIGCREFIEMYKELSTRPEIYFLLIRFANKDFLLAEDLQLFLEGEQGMTGLTADRCREIISTFEPSEEARKCGQLHIDGFSQYLLSKECDIFDEKHKSVCEDMTQPLSHYFISTSHNTYLLKDQLKGPSSTEGYIAALRKGCRCIKIDCWDGGDDGPVVYHGNTLTSRVSFKEVINVIKEYAFKTSKYPLIIHLENHCSPANQRFMAALLRSELGDVLYIPSPAQGQSICELSPEQIGSKIILKGKKLNQDCDQSEGEVSEEDDAGETHVHKKRKWSERLKMTLCRELSDLIGIRRMHFTSFQSARQQIGVAETFSLGESTAAKLAHACHEDFVQHNKHFLTRIFPNASRIDSSNYNPQDFWNCGCQMVALNFQTPGKMRDLFDGRFLQNGECGYVLKPSIMREPVSVFPVTQTKGIIPGLASQNLRLKVISGQNLPRPKGSTAKGDSIDPYVVVQIFGIPADCAVVQTKTVSNEGNCPIFDDSFEFQINLPELALVRFVVLDDEFIGDDFIGQYALPFECIQTGYRHIRLLDSDGQRLGDNCTLFVHLAITNKKGGGKHQKKFRKVHSDIRCVGLKAIDDVLRNVSPSIIEAEVMRSVTEMAMNDLQEELGLVETANIKQCLRILITRISTSSDDISVNIVAGKFPELQVTGQPSAHMNKAIALFDKVLHELRHVVEKSGSQLEILTNAYSTLLEMYDNLETMCSQAGIKGKKLTKMLDIYAWNMQILRGQIDLLESCLKGCRVSLEQMHSSTDTRLFGSFRSKDRSPVFGHEKPRLALHERGPFTDEMISSLRSPTSPCDGHPRGILKNRSNSSNNLDPKMLTSTIQSLERS